MLYFTKKIVFQMDQSLEIVRTISNDMTSDSFEATCTE